MNSIPKILLALVTGAFIGGASVWFYLYGKTGQAFIAHLDAKPSEVQRELLVASEYNKGNIEMAKKLAFFMFLNEHSGLEVIISAPELSDVTKQRYIEARDAVAEYLLRYPAKGCERSRSVNELRQCAQENI